MLGAIALIPGVLALWVGFTRSPHAAFLWVYLPAMLLMPDYYRWDVPGLPSPSFGMAAAFGTAASFFVRGLPGYRFSATDLIVFCFVAACFISEFRATNYSDAQNLLINQLGWIILPYLFAKSLVEPAGLRLAFAKTIVLCLFLISVVSVYEFRFGTTPWRMLFDPFFPGQGRGWITTFRWGFARVAGPYGHAILAGVILVVGYRIQRWLEWSQAWPERWHWLPWLPLRPAQLLTLGLLAGVIMTMVRGPWMGAGLAAMMVAIGRSRQRVAAIGVVLGLLVFVGVPAVIWFIDWVSVGRAGALTVSQETAAYRWELLTKYADIAAEQRWFGWGLNDWPKVPGMPSIDNYYLLLLLQHGLIALVCLLVLIFSMLIRLTAHGMRQPLAEPRGSSLAFTLASLYLAIALSIATVFLGLQTIPLFFLITGWSDSYLRAGVETAPAAAAAPTAPRLGFARVMT